MRRSQTRKQFSTVETTDPLAIAAERLLAPIEADPAPVEEQTEPEIEETELEASDEVESEQPEAPAEPEKPQLYTVKVDGKELEVTLEDLTRSFSGQAYIQAKMQETAAAKKQAEQAFQALQTEQRRVLELAQAIQQQGIVPPPILPPAELAQKDPVAYIRAKAQYDAHLQQYQSQQREIYSVQEQTRAAEQAAMSANLEMQAAELAQRIPEFANPETAAKTKAKLISVGKEYGFSDSELMGVTDARTVQVLNDAAKWRELQASTAAAKKTPAATRTVIPAARRPEPAQLARAKVLEAAKKTDRLDDWAKALLK